MSRFSLRQQTVLCLLIVAFLPLVSPSVVTTVSEDMVILVFLGSYVFWWRQGWPFPTGLRLIVDFLAFGFLFVVVWLNQIPLIPDWGRLIYWPVICLILAVCLAGGADRREKGSLRLLPLTLLVSLVGLVLSQALLPTALPKRPYYYGASHLVPRCMVVAGLFALFIFVRSARYVARRKVYLAVPLVFGLFLGMRGCYQDGQALRTWWKAGETERSVRVWVGEGDETARRTCRLYSRLLNTLDERGGQFTRICGFDFLARCRLAETAKRMRHPIRMLTALTPRLWITSGEARFLSDLWTVSELNLLRKEAEDPGFLLRLRSPREGGVQWEYHVDLYVDHEISEDGSVVWFLDRWGRVFRARNQGPLEPVWESASGEGRSDAVDLEIWDKAIVVAFADGEIRVHGEAPTWFDPYWRISLSPGERLVNIERRPFGQGVVMLTSFGELSVIGSVPKEFPIPEKPLFHSPVAADLELSSDGLGWYVLDVYGAIHALSGGNRFPMAQDAPGSKYWAIKTPYAPYWPVSMAVDMELDSSGHKIHLLNRLGEIWTLAETNAKADYRPFGGQEETAGLGVSLAIQKDGVKVALFAPGNLVFIP